MIVKRLGEVEYAPALEAMRVFTAAAAAQRLRAACDSVLRSAAAALSSTPLT